MPTQPTRPRKQHPHIRAAIEIAFIIFLFYANLLMGEYTRHGAHRPLLTALRDIVTPATLLIGFTSAVTAHFVFETLRKHL